MRIPSPDRLNFGILTKYGSPTIMDLPPQAPPDDIQTVIVSDRLEFYCASKDGLERSAVLSSSETKCSRVLDITRFSSVLVRLHFHFSIISTCHCNAHQTQSRFRWYLYSLSPVWEDSGLLRYSTVHATLWFNHAIVPYRLEALCTSYIAAPCGHISKRFMRITFCPVTHNHFVSLLVPCIV